jgi:hypothetical protein
LAGLICAVIAIVGLGLFVTATVELGVALIIPQLSFAFEVMV